MPPEISIMILSKKYDYKPKLVNEIILRKFDFEFLVTLGPFRIPNSLVRDYFGKGISLTKPYLEPHLLDTTHSDIPAPFLLNEGDNK